MIFDFLLKFFSRKWLGMGSMNGEFEHLSIDNKFDLNGAQSGLQWLGATFTNTHLLEFNKVRYYIVVNKNNNQYIKLKLTTYIILENLLLDIYHIHILSRIEFFLFTIIFLHRRSRTFLLFNINCRYNNSHCISKTNGQSSFFDKEQHVAVIQGQSSNMKNIEIADGLATNQQYVLEKFIRVNIQHIT